MLPNNLEYKILISIHIVATRTIRARKESIKTGVSEHSAKTEITERLRWPLHSSWFALNRTNEFWLYNSVI